MARSSPVTIHQLKVTLTGIRPPVWRRIQVPSAVDLRALHELIQAAMGWTNSHLYMFLIGRAEFSEPDPLSGSTESLPKATRLGRVAPMVGDKMSYVYDFGDHWEHRIIVERVFPAEAGVTYPRCVAGRRACPPEDVGGPWGYGDFLQSLSDPNDPEHESVAQWIGTRFDPSEFSLDECNERMRHPPSGYYDE